MENFDFLIFAVGFVLGLSIGLVSLENDVVKDYTTTIDYKSITFSMKDCDTDLIGDEPFMYTEELIKCSTTFPIDSLDSDSLWNK